MKSTSDQIPARTIDEYMVGLPENVVEALENLRQTIKTFVPNAEELISYQIPTFKYHGSLVAFAAFKDHCSFFVMSPALMKAFQEELKPYKTATATIHFTPEKPLPESLVTAIVKARIRENEYLTGNKKTSSAAKSKLPKQNDSEKVSEFMAQLDYPLKAEVEALRTIIKSADSQLEERIKWNAPSYFTKADLLTFNLHVAKQIRLVFHHPAIVKIQSDLLEGNYPDRRLMNFSTMKEIETKKAELLRILKEYINLANIE